MTHEVKEKAVELMKALDIYQPYILGFRDKGKVCLFERFGGYYVDQEEFKEIEAKKWAIEDKYKITVFAITHEFTNLGELYNFLYVPAEKEEWDSLLEKAGNRTFVQAYCWNKSVEWCSEFGQIGVTSFGGGIMRVA